MDISKAGRELGWRPRRRFEEGLRGTVKWYLGNLGWCDKVLAGNYGRRRLGLGKA
jgi:dTDP-glucose 4,6-dehydratase